MNVLAIGAHPDDVDIWCGGTLKKYSKQGHKIFICDVANGNLGTCRYSAEEIVRIRESEQLESAKIYGAEVKFLGYNDAEVIDSFELRKSVLDAIRWADPDVILTHYPYDTSTDHGVTGELVSRILLSISFNNIKTQSPPIMKSPSVFFCDTYAGLGFQPEIYVDITDEFESKREAFKKHKSQIEYSSADRGWEYILELLSAFRGLQSGYKYAEGFIGFRMYGFMPDFKLLP